MILAHRYVITLLLGLEAMDLELDEDPWINAELIRVEGFRDFSGRVSFGLGNEWKN